MTYSIGRETTGRETTRLEGIQKAEVFEEPTSISICEKINEFFQEVGLSKIIGGSGAGIAIAGAIVCVLGFTNPIGAAILSAGLCIWLLTLLYHCFSLIGSEPMAARS